MNYIQAKNDAFVTSRTKMHKWQITNGDTLCMVHKRASDYRRQ